MITWENQNSTRITMFTSNHTQWVAKITSKYGEKKKNDKHITIIQKVKKAFFGKR